MEWSLVFDDRVQCRAGGYMGQEQFLECRSHLQSLVRSGTGEARFDDYDHTLSVTIGGNGAGSFWVAFSLNCTEIGPSNSSRSSPGYLAVEATLIPIGPEEARTPFDFVNQWAHEIPT